MDVSIVIINWNSTDYLRNCLQSIEARTSGIHYETIVADNGSSEPPGESVRREFPRVRFLRFKHNLGFAGANNRAARKANGRYILYLNPDTRLITNAITGMVRFLDTHPAYSIVGCQLLEGNGGIQGTCARTFPSPWRQFSQLAMLDRIFPRLKMLSSIELRYWDHRDSRDIECISGACLMIRAEVMRRLRGFDERLFMYAEDVDLCYRLGRAGGRIYYLASEQIIHYGGGSSGTHTAARILSTLRQREATLYLLHKHFGAVRAWAFRLAVFAGTSVRLAIIIAATALRGLLGERLAVPPGAWRRYWSLLAWSIGLKQVVTQQRPA